jgi:regulator of chromosome condensation
MKCPSSALRVLVAKGYRTSPKTTTKRVSKGAAPKRVAKRDRTPPPSLNPLPMPPDHPRPPRQLFVWGVGGMGQLGMGPDFLDDVAKPKLHKWCQESIEEGRFGGEGAGIESITAGGMHSFMIDEEGKVRTCGYCSIFLFISAAYIVTLQVWSWGVNDDAALGRQTKDVKDADENPVDADELSYTPHVVEDLVEQNFRAVQVVGGDSIGAVLSERGQLRIWGSFKVRPVSSGNYGTYRADLFRSRPQKDTRPSRTCADVESPRLKLQRNLSDQWNSRALRISISPPSPVATITSSH